MNSIEIVKTRSGEWYSISQSDMAIFVNESKKFLQRYISNDKTVGLFLDLDNANFCSIILYQACIACGASVIRCGISDFDRQLSILNELKVDMLICTESAHRFIKNKLDYDMEIIIKPIENNNSQLNTLDSLYIYDFYDIPGFLVSLSGMVLCPGYIIKYNDTNKAIYIQTVKNIKRFKITDYYLNFSLPVCHYQDDELNIALDYIKLQVRTMLKEALNGKIVANEDIELTSIGMVELLVRLEETFEISISIEKISKNTFENLTFIAELIYSMLMEDYCDD